MNGTLNCPFLGISLHNSSDYRNNGCFVNLHRAKPPKRSIRRRVYAKHNEWIARANRFSQFCGQHLKLLRGKFRSRDEFLVKCIKEHSQTRSIVSFLSPLWKEGLFLVRCSVFVAVISGVCLLVWYGQTKAKAYIESKLLPSVSSVLSEYIQREFNFGTVQRISPLSITLESCSVGPHKEEFSCGVLPTMKLRILPFASLRRGRIVIDAVLSHPSILVVQKKDYTWLGIPSFEGVLLRRCATEEGIDYRTKTRRIAREEAGYQWAKDRDDAAVEAAEMGYILPEMGPSSYDSNALKEGGSSLLNFTKAKPFFCMDENMNWRDHQCMDTGVDYDNKHADLEKSFGVKNPGLGLKFWSMVIKGPKLHKIKRKPNRNDLSAYSFIAKRKLLDRGALAALEHFKDLSQRNFSESLETSRGYDVVNLDTLWNKNEGESKAESDGITNVDQVEFPLVASRIERDSFLMTRDINVVRDEVLLTTINCDEERKPDEIADKNNENNSKTDEMEVNVGAKLIENGTFDIQGDHVPPTSTSTVVEPMFGFFGKYTTFPNWSLSLISGPPSFSKNVGEQMFCFLSGAIQKLKSGMGPWVNDFVAELADGGDEFQTEGIEKVLPISLDSVHFKGGTLMLLAYGDRQPREMENVNGHVKFQNHYGQVHVQLSGNCRMWRSDVVSKDGGLLSADVFVDIIDQKWHANLKVVNLFAPLFERILEIPITWSKGRATGSLVHVKRRNIS